MLRCTKFKSVSIYQQSLVGAVVGGCLRVSTVFSSAKLIDFHFRFGKFAFVLDTLLLASGGLSKWHLNYKFTCGDAH